SARVAGGIWADDGNPHGRAIRATRTFAARAYTLMRLAASVVCSCADPRMWPCLRNQAPCLNRKCRLLRMTEYSYRSLDRWLIPPLLRPLMYVYPREDTTTRWPARAADTNRSFSSR